MREILDSYIESTFGSYEQAEFKFRQFKVNYKHLFPRNKDTKVVNVGIGRGEMLMCMKNWGYSNYLGIDVTENTVAFCKSLGLQCILVEDIPAWLNTKKSVFQMITMLDVLEHIKKEDTISFLKAIRTALTATGLLIVQVPNSQAPDRE